MCTHHAFQVFLKYLVSLDACPLRFEVPGKMERCQETQTTPFVIARHFCRNTKDRDDTATRTQSERTSRWNEMNKVPSTRVEASRISMDFYGFLGCLCSTWNHFCIGATKLQQVEPKAVFEESLTLSVLHLSPLHPYVSRLRLSALASLLFKRKSPDVFSYFSFFLARCVSQILQKPSQTISTPQVARLHHPPECKNSPWRDNN